MSFKSLKEEKIARAKRELFDVMLSTGPSGDGYATHISLSARAQQALGAAAGNLIDVEIDEESGRIRLSSSIKKGWKLQGGGDIENARGSFSIKCRPGVPFVKGSAVGTNELQETGVGFSSFVITLPEGVVFFQDGMTKPVARRAKRLSDGTTDLSAPAQQ